LKYLSEKGAFLDSNDNDDRTALDYARQFKNLFGVKYLKNKIISRVYIKQKNVNFLLVLMKVIFSLLYTINPRASTLSHVKKLKILPLKEDDPYFP